MAECIEREALIEERRRAIWVYENANILNAQAIREGLKPLLDKIVDVPAVDPVHVASGTYCHECHWFDLQGYENTDYEYPELWTGWCDLWRRDTQACNFCNRGMIDSAGSAGVD